MANPEKRAARAVNLANVLSTARMGLIPFFIIALLAHRSWTALVIFVVAGVTDGLDGLIARRYGMMTHFGAYLDPMADKILTTAGYVVLSIPLGFVNRIPPWLSVLVISRDVMISVAALIMYLTSAVTKFPVSFFGKIHTGVQVATLAILLLFNGLGTRSLLVDVAVWTTLATTLVSGFHYLFRSVQTVSVALGPGEEGRPPHGPSRD